MLCVYSNSTPKPFCLRPSLEVVNHSLLSLQVVFTSALSRLQYQSSSQLHSITSRSTSCTTSCIVTALTEDVGSSKGYGRGGALSNSDDISETYPIYLQEVEHFVEMVGLMILNLSTTNDIVKPEAKLTGLDQIDVCEIFHSDGLLLCIPKYHSRLLVWNTYWGRQQPRFIDYPQKFVEFKIYDFNSDSWRIILDLLPPRDWRIRFDERGVSVKGNTCWFASSETSNSFLVCFDFTRETFWSPLPLPFEAFPGQDTLSLSTTSVNKQKLVVLFQRCDTLTMEIWISTTIEQPNAVSWNPNVFLSANIKQLVHPLWQFWPFACFFIDEEKKVAVVFDKNNHMG
ncbi:hypothetical protein Bca101_074724 [Brassica carinata]